MHEARHKQAFTLPIVTMADKIKALDKDFQDQYPGARLSGRDSAHAETMAKYAVACLKVELITWWQGRNSLEWMRQALHLDHLDDEYYEAELQSIVDAEPHQRNLLYPWIREHDVYIGPTVQQTRDHYRRELGDSTSALSEIFRSVRARAFRSP